MPAPSCPELAQLERLVLGQLPDAEAEALEAHVLSCPQCSEAVSRVRAVDSLVEAVQARKPLAPEADRDLVHGLIGRLKVLYPHCPADAGGVTAVELPSSDPATDTHPPVRPAALSPDQTAEVYDFLAPAEEPGYLGRLGSYRVRRVLGTGGMGVVFLAEDPQLQRPVALKAMLPSLGASASAKQRFLREARAAAAVKHDHIVTIHQVGEDRGVPFLAMEFLDGESLEERLQRENKLSLAEVLRIGSEIAEGLEAAHEGGLIHRDVKPANVWLEGKKGRVKILDFGLARVTDQQAHLTQSGAIVGTPAYMAPEQGQGLPVDGRSDLFSLGCVLYRMCTGVLPFRGVNAISTLMAVVNENPRSPREVSAEVPEALSALVLRLLAKAPEQRPASAQDVAEELEAIAEEVLPQREPRRRREASATAVLRPSPPDAPVPPRRSRRVVPAVGVLLLAGLAALGVVIIRDRQGREIARVVVPEGGTVEMKEDGPKAVKQGEEPPAPRDREKPFVLIRDGKDRREFKSLEGALNELRAGDVIEVHGNGPFLIGPVQLKGMNLYLRAAPGYRPRFRPDMETLGGHAEWFKLESTPVRIEGCDFSISSPHRGFSGSGAPWEFRDCRFFHPGTTAIEYQGGPQFRAEGCLSAGEVFARTGYPSGAKVELVNNLVMTYGGVLSTALSLVRKGKQEIRLQDNTFIGCVFRFENGPAYTETVRVEATGNLFHCYNVSFLHQFVPSDFKSWFHWQGQHNLYTQNALQLRSNDGKINLNSLADWNKYWGKEEEGSRGAKAGEIHYRWEEIGRQAPNEQVASLRHQTTELRRRHGLAKLGPDWDLVGPGEAYVRALAAQGQAVPKEKLRLPAPIGGPFVVVRNGNDLSGYPTVQEAMSAAADGDTVEIRSDKTFKINAWWGKTDSKRFTLGAAPGYHPVWRGYLQSPVAWTLTLEGIAFERDDEQQTMLLEGCYVRIANCSFRWTGRGPGGGALLRHVVFQPNGGKSPELVNCLLPQWGSGVKWPAQLIIRNSVLGWFDRDEMTDNTRQLMLDRCIVWNPLPPDLGCLSTFRGQLKPLTVEARHTLFQANNQPLWNGDPRLLTWTGSGNLYRIGYHPWMEGMAWEKNPILDLAGWRKHFHSDADSAEGEPLYYDPQQWRLLPDSAGHSQGPGGRDIGADVDKVARPATDRPVPPVAPPKIASRDKPFVLLRQGAEVGAFASFAAVWDVHQPGDEIVVHGDGPFLVPQVQVKDRALVLKAAPGYRPVFRPDPSLFAVKNYTWILLDKSALTVEGCDFAMRGQPPGVEPSSLFSGGDGPCVFRSCRFLGFGLLTRDLLASTFSLEDCLLSWLWYGLGTLPARCEVTLTNNLIYCKRLWIFAPPGGQVVRLTRNAIVLPTSSPYFDGLGRTGQATGIAVTAEGNLFNLFCLGGRPSGPIRPEDLKSLRWQGKDNWYAGLGGTLEAWNAKLPQPESNAHALPSLPFGWWVDQPGVAENALPWWQTRLAEVRQESGLNDLGPDLSLVGPGDAYLRGLAAEGKPVAREQLRPEPLPGGRVAVIRDGQATRGFLALQDALNDARDGDVLEIRTDATLNGAEVPADRGSLTLRAGPGYHPVLQTPLNVKSGSVLAVEGLTFAKDSWLEAKGAKGLPLEKQGRISRLAYCAFDHRGTPDNFGQPSIDGLFGGREGAPGEMSRCILLSPFTIRINKNVSLHIRECVLNCVRWSGSDDKTDVGAMELEACIMTAITPSFWTILLSRESAKQNMTRHVARRCLFESNATFCVHPGPKEVFTWSGERNCYRIAEAWAGDWGISSLAQWRAQTGSPETGSVEGEAPIAEPRTWKLRPGSLPNGIGPDVDRIGRRTLGGTR
jgi:predicted Ser/Thr protein kinase